MTAVFLVGGIIFGLGELFHFAEKFVGYVVRNACPNIDNFVITFAFGNNTGFGLGLNLFDFRLGFINHGLFFRRNGHIGNRDGQAGQGSIVIPHLHNLIQELHGFIAAVFFALVAFIYQRAEFFFTDGFIDIFPTFRHGLVENDTSYGSIVFPFGGIFFFFAT